MEKSKGKKIAIIVIVAIFAAAVVGVSVWQITVDVMAKNIGLVKVNDLSYDAPLDVVAEEGDVQLQDVRMHYAKCGSGYPLLLVHGNGNSHKDLADLMLRLANHYTVYALDSRSQGESGYTDEISYALMAKDV